MASCKANRNRPSLIRMTADEHQQGKRFRGRVRFGNSLERADHNPDRRQQQHGGDDRCRDGFGFAVAVGMILIRRFCRDHDSAPDNDGTENIRHRFHGVGHERVGMAENAREHFHRREHGIRCESEKRGAETSFKP